MIKTVTIPLSEYEKMKSYLESLTEIKNKYDSIAHFPEDYKKQINDLLIKMLVDEIGIGETVKELLNLFAVSNQREFLVDFGKQILEHQGAYPNDEWVIEKVDQFTLNYYR